MAKGKRRFKQMVSWVTPQGFTRESSVQHEYTAPIKMSNKKRESNYRKQNGSRPLTPRQRGRLNKHARRTGGPRYV